MAIGSKQYDLARFINYLNVAHNFADAYARMHEIESVVNYQSVIILRYYEIINLYSISLFIA